MKIHLTCIGLAVLLTILAGIGLHLVLPYGPALALNTMLGVCFGGLASIVGFRWWMDLDDRARRAEILRRSCERLEHIRCSETQRLRNFVTPEEKR